MAAPGGSNDGCLSWLFHAFTRPCTRPIAIPPPTPAFGSLGPDSRLKGGLPMKSGRRWGFGRQLTCSDDTSYLWLFLGRRNEDLGARGSTCKHWKPIFLYYSWNLTKKPERVSRKENERKQHPSLSLYPSSNFFRRYRIPETRQKAADLCRHTKAYAHSVYIFGLVFIGMGRSGYVIP